MLQIVVLDTAVQQTWAAYEGLAKLPTPLWA